MTSEDKFPAIFFLLLSAFICIESLHLDLGDWRKPGSGLFPFWSGAAVGVLGLVILFQSWKGKATEEEREIEISWRGIILCFFALSMYILLLDISGFIMTTFLFIGFLMKIVERKGWVATILTASGIAVASYGFFARLLHSELPKGIFGI